MAADFQRLLSRFAVPCTLTKSRVGATMLILTHEHIRLYEKQFTSTGDGATRLRTKLNRLDERGAVVIDANKIAREVVEPGTPGLAAVPANRARESAGRAALPDGPVRDRARRPRG